MPLENKNKVRLMPAAALAPNAPAGARALTFDASPNVSESRTVNYNSLDPLHAPGQIQVYKNTSSRTFQISDIKLISRTVKEADENLKKLWTLRAWCMPRFGNSSTLDADQRFERDRKNGNDARRKDPKLKAKLSEIDYSATDFGTELLGAPPPILLLSAYSRGVGDTSKASATGVSTTRWDIAQHINRIPTVIQQLTIPYPNDIDYITTTNDVPMPIIMNIDITLIETHSPNSYEAFDLNAFKEGRLQGF